MSDDPEESDGSRKLKQNGFYVQAVYGLLPRLQLGVRWDMAGMKNAVETGTLTESFGSTSRSTAAFTVNPTEFSRFRFQYEYVMIPLSGVKAELQPVLPPVPGEPRRPRGAQVLNGARR